jgi:hypothetical protein
LKNTNTFQNDIINICDKDFEAVALALFRHQAVYNLVYNEYINYLGIVPSKITQLSQIPFLPISFFKNHVVKTCYFEPSAVFESSGTTQAQTSRHYVKDLDWYKKVSQHIFEQQYGSLTHFHILALLPSYLERQNSSLVYMVEYFIAQSGSQYSGFYLNNTVELLENLHQLAVGPKPFNQSVVLWGVTFALLDLVEAGHDLSFLQNIPELIVMETGGMKGRRQELLRDEVHQILTTALGLKTIHSEYGMTELLSQAYSKGEGVFSSSPTLRVLLRDINDPFAVYDASACPFRYGGINVVDLANIDSCAFIETQDLGRFASKEGDFEVIGRFDNSDVRGCNLMI